MKKTFSKLAAAATLLSSALLISVAPAGATSALSGNSSVSVNESSQSSGIITPYAIKDTLTWDLNGNVVDPSTSYSITVGYPNIKLYAKNTGAYDFRIEVKHNAKNKVIFDKTVKAGGTVEAINNDSSPTVPSGDYTVTVYGGSGKPKGQVVLKSSDTKWQ
ncbi:hypothetical protein [Paenibacillus sp. UNC499MF]|uniref:hypothetical protein n=1 Tax=Paenibacillus sp. UNC499MF TaxID=1502751 RepID=UPI0008A01003|nr:hypothetical protein [Paenibacillus sp. UNC499MF]SEF70515.1 hypothetical protein SAMN02799616_00937 [Paenibacillus sp. UNC499MF]